MNELDHENLFHSANALDLSPTDYSFFKHLENFLRDKYFKNKDDTKDAFNALVASGEKYFYSSGIYKLIHCW